MVSGTNDRYLRKEAALPIVYEKMEPVLKFAQLIRLVPEDDEAFLYRYNDVSVSDDTKKKYPPMYLQGAGFPELDYTRPSTGAGMTESRGFAMRIPRNVIRRAAGVNEIMKAYEVAGFWLAQFVNTEITSVMTGGATAPSTSWTPTATWDAAGATPVDDLIRLSAFMDQEGYNYQMTDYFVHKDNWYELKAYLTSLDAQEYKQKAMFGLPEIKKDVMYVPVVDANIHKMKSGITEGYILGMDAQQPGAEYHYFVDPKYATAKVTYQTVVDGKKAAVTVPNLGIHFNQYEELNTHDTIMQFWYEGKAVVVVAKALVYDSGI